MITVYRWTACTVVTLLACAAQDFLTGFWQFIGIFLAGALVGIIQMEMR